MLTLPIKKKWFDMIVSGEKLEEYREITPYYKQRLERYTGETIDLILRNGYSKESKSINITAEIKLGTGNVEWGAIKNEVYFVLKIIKIGGLKWYI